MIRTILVTILGIQAASLTDACAQVALTSSSVELQITDNYGHPLREARISVNGPGTVLRSIDRRILELQRGSYAIVVDVPGFDTFRSTVVIDQPEQILSIAMRLGAYERAQVPCSINGTVDQFQGGIRVRLISMFGAEVRDAPVKDDGAFQFGTLECGAYMLVAIRDAEPIGFAYPVATGRGTSVRLALQHPKGNNVVAPEK